jgi:hypothetical protein
MHGPINIRLINVSFPKLNVVQSRRI